MQPPAKSLATQDRWNREALEARSAALLRHRGRQCL